VLREIDFIKNNYSVDPLVSSSWRD